jgi:hypothetical protein
LIGYDEIIAELEKQHKGEDVEAKVNVQISVWVKIITTTS